MNRYKWMTIYTLGVLGIVLLSITIIGMLIIMMVARDTPDEVVSNWRNYCKSKIMPNFRLVTNGHRYIIQKQTFIKWEDCYNVQRGNTEHTNKQDALDFYRRVVQQYKHSHAKWEEVTIPEETKLGKAMNK